MSDCCPRINNKHHESCAAWWEQAYSSENRKRNAAESQVAALTASLDQCREHDSAMVDAVERRDASLASMTKERDDLRKRIDGGVKALRDLNGKVVTDIFITDHSYIINNYDAEQALLASPPSPAPPKDCPRVIGGMICQRTVGHDGDHWLTPAPVESKPDPYCVPGPDGVIACPTCRTAVESKPKEGA